MLRDALQMCNLHMAEGPEKNVGDITPWELNDQHVEDWAPNFGRWMVMDEYFFACGMGHLQFNCSRLIREIR